MAWENKPLTNYTEGPWGKTLVTHAEKPSNGDDGFAQLAMVQYDPATGKRVDDVMIHWNIRELKKQRKRLEDELASVNAKITHVQDYFKTMPAPEQLPVTPAA